MHQNITLEEVEGKEEDPPEDKKPEVITFIMDGIEFTEDEVIMLVWLNGGDSILNPVQMFKFFMYHLLHFIFPPLGILVIILMEGCNLNVPYNLGFVGLNRGSIS